ncbi:MAG: 7-cyano-7-deazaguanine synthase QueC [Alphaproteobacteria bacterium]|nr:7-cyano-7-deazaguanine synthase QueC [Alphaproteobacteria bacterium]
MSGDNTAHNSALVLFSGGQDSACCLAWALHRFDHVETVGFDFSQRHRIELKQRQIFLTHLQSAFPHWAKKLGQDHNVTLEELAQFGETALTHDVEIKMTAAGLPSTFVPGRNLLFFTYAAAIGYRAGIKTLVGGMCETDFSGYPDCRNDTIRSLETTLSLGMGQDFQLITPLMFLDKAATWELTAGLGGDPLVNLVIEDTHTCYRGERAERHAWGYGCDDCPACALRSTGYERWRTSEGSVATA